MHGRMFGLMMGMNSDFCKQNNLQEVFDGRSEVGAGMIFDTFCVEASGNVYV